MSASNTNQRPPRLEPGRVIDGRYSIEGPLGEGGYAAVYRARHIKLGNEVALKVLSIRPKNDDEANTFEERFLREAQIGARIRHRDVVTVHDFGVMPDTMQPYIAMELLDGHDLAEELERRGPLNPTRCFRLFLGVLDAIQKGHEEGVVHKDLKPSNLFLAEAGSQRERLIVLDYGIARLYEDPDSRLTRTGGVSGTPLYLAPEYIADQTAVPQTDVYQLGLILVEALTGIPPAQADNPLGCVANHAMGRLTIPGTIRDSALAPVVTRALSKEYETRYADAGELRDALKAVDPHQLSDLTSEVHPALETAVRREDIGIAKTGAGDALSLDAIQEAATQALPSEHRERLEGHNAAKAEPGSSRTTNRKTNRKTRERPDDYGPTFEPDQKPAHPLTSSHKPTRPVLWWGLGILVLLAALIFIFWPLGGSRPDDTQPSPEPKLVETGDETPETRGHNQSAIQKKEPKNSPTANGAENNGAEKGASSSLLDPAPPENPVNPDDKEVEPPIAAPEIEPSVLSVTTSPRRVNVFLEGNLLGKTPLQLNWEDVEAPATLTFRRRGYVSREKTVEADTETLEVKLERKKRRGDQTSGHKTDKDEEQENEPEDDEQTGKDPEGDGENNGATGSDPVMVAP